MGAVQPADISRSSFGVADLTSRIGAEYRELPGLNLSARQVQRMWGVDAATVAIALDTLVAAKFLARTSNGLYVLVNAERRDGYSAEKTRLISGFATSRRPSVPAPELFPLERQRQRVEDAACSRTVEWRG